MKLLLIDSDANFAESLRAALRGAELEVAVAHDGDLGLDMARLDPPDAVVLSVELGDRASAGYSLCTRIKRDPQLAEVPVILTSALATEETFAHHRKLKIHADAYLLKPYDAKGLLDALSPLLPIDAAPAGTVEQLADELLGVEEELETVEAIEVAPDATQGADAPEPGLDEMFVDLAAGASTEAVPEVSGVEIGFDDPGSTPGPEAAWETPVAEEPDRKEANASSQAHQEELAELQGELAGARREIEALYGRLASLERESAEAKRESAVLRAELTTMQEQLDEAERKAAHDEEIRGRLADALAEAQRILAESPAS